MNFISVRNFFGANKNSYDESILLFYFVFLALCLSSSNLNDKEKYNQTFTTEINKFCFLHYEKIKITYYDNIQINLKLLDFKWLNENFFLFGNSLSITGLRPLFINLFLEILNSASIFKKKFKKNNFPKKNFILNYSYRLRYFIFLIKIFKNLIKNNLIFFNKNRNSLELREIFRIIIEKNELNSFNIFTKIILSDKKALKTRYLPDINFYKKIEKDLLILNTKTFQLKHNKKIVCIYILNSILFNKLIANNKNIGFYKRLKMINWKNVNSSKNVFKYIKEELFLYSVELFKKKPKKNEQLIFFENFKRTLSILFGDFLVNNYNFSFLQECLFFFEKFKKYSTYRFFRKNDDLNFSKIFLSKALLKMESEKQKMNPKLKKKKKNISKLSNSLLKRLILSNSIGRFSSIILYLITYKTLKNALEISWRIQTIGRYVKFFSLKSKQSIKFNSNILKFTMGFLDKIISKLSGDFLPLFYSKLNSHEKNSNILMLLESFFWDSVEFLGLNSVIIVKQLNRILALGNFYLLTIFRFKKIIKILNNSTMNQTKINLGLNEAKLFLIFEKKIDILLKNLDNSLKFFEIRGFFS